MQGIIMIVYVFVICVLMYFIAIKPQKKEQKKKQELMNSIEKGDFVLTTSGFYGVIIDITEDDVIVEFGNNKNCRISMRKSALSRLRSQQHLHLSSNNIQEYFLSGSVLFLQLYGSKQKDWHTVFIFIFSQYAGKGFCV